MSDDFQAEIAFLGIASSPAFVREPEGNGCIERFFRTLKEQLLWVRDFTALEDLPGALEEFRQRYNDHWLVERLSFQPPRQARREAACPRGCCMMIIKKTVQEIGCGTRLVSVSVQGKVLHGGGAVIFDVYSGYIHPEFNSPRA